MGIFADKAELKNQDMKRKYLNSKLPPMYLALIIHTLDKRLGLSNDYNSRYSPTQYLHSAGELSKRDYIRWSNVLAKWNEPDWRSQLLSCKFL